MENSKEKVNKAVAFDMRQVLSVFLPLLALYTALDGGGWQLLPSSTVYLFVVAGVIVFISTSRSFRLPPLSASIIGVVFLVAILATFLITYSYDKSLGSFLYNTGIALTFFLGVNIAAPKYRTRAVTLLIISFAVVILVGYWIYIAARLGVIPPTHDMLHYFFATFYWKNPAAGYIVLFLPLVWIYGLCRTAGASSKFRILFVILGILGAAALLLTRSRGAFLALGISLVIFGWTAFPLLRGWRRWGTVAVMAILSVVIAIVLLPPKTERARAMVNAGRDAKIMNAIPELGQGPARQERSTVERVEMLQMGLHIYKDHPLLGVGFGAFIVAYPSYLKSSHYLSKHLHNQYLQYLVEGGTVGGLSFAGLIVVLIILLLRRVLHSKDDPYPVGVLLGFTALALHIGLDFDYDFSGITFPAALLVGMALGTPLADTGGDSNSVSLHKLSRIASILIVSILFLLGAARLGAELLHRKADSLAAMGNYPNSAETEMKAHRLNPLSAFYNYSLGILAKEWRRESDALRWFGNAYRLEPNSSFLCFQYGKQLYDTGNKNEGIKLIKRSVELAPYSSPQHYNILAKILLEKGDISEAMELYSDVIDRFSGDPSTEYTARTASYRYYIGHSYIGLGEIVAARDSAYTLIKHGERLVCPRKWDAIATFFGMKIVSPEWVVFQTVESNNGKQTELYSTDDVTYDLLAGKSTVMFTYLAIDKDGELHKHSGKLNLTLSPDGWQITGGNR